MSRPRRSDAGGTGVGALIGAALSGGAGALVGGILGAAATQRAIPLEQAIQEELLARGLQLVNVYREAPNRMTVLFASSPSQYWSVNVEGQIIPTWSREQIDDALFDGVVRELEEWCHQHAR
jgi:hypothetical protein